MKFRHLSAGERAVFCSLLALVLITNIVALIVSYSAALKFVEGLGMFPPKLVPLFPALGDITLLVCEVAVIYGWMIRHRVGDTTAVNRGAAWLGMLFAAATTLAANEMHAGHSWSHRLMAAFAPVIAFILFNVALSMIKWTLMALGRYSTETTVIQGATIEPFESSGTSTSLQAGQTGQKDLAARKAELARLVCRAKNHDELAAATDSSVKKEVRGLFDIDIDRTWAAKALSDVRAERNGRRRVGERG